MTLAITLTAIAAVGSLIFDAVAIAWHHQDRKERERDTFPIVCANGCPEGYRGDHKFSCELARKSRDARAGLDNERS